MKTDWQSILEMLLYRAQAESWREMAFILGMALLLAKEGRKARSTPVSAGR